MVSDLVLQADRFQSTPDELREKNGWPAAVRCPRHHTKLWPAAGGTSMMCVSKETKDSYCSFALGIDQHLVAQTA